MTAPQPRETVVRAANLRGHGLSPHEEQVMALFDAGQSIEAIAQATRRSRRSVEVIVQRYHVGGADTWARAARDATAALLAAIEMHHPEIARAV